MGNVTVNYGSKDNDKSLVLCILTSISIGLSRAYPESEAIYLQHRMRDWFSKAIRDVTNGLQTQLNALFPCINDSAGPLEYSMLLSVSTIAT